MSRNTTRPDTTVPHRGAVPISDPELIAELRAHAARLDRTLSWVAQHCVRVALPTVRLETAPPKERGKSKRRRGR